MNTLKLTKDEVSKRGIAKPDTLFRKPEKYVGYLILGLLILLWPVMRRIINGTDETVGYIDPNIWLLILISLICFMLIIGLCWWVLHQFWMSLGLPALGNMVLQFKELSTWQQLGFYWASLALLFFAALACLVAIC